MYLRKNREIIVWNHHVNRAIPPWVWTAIKEIRRCGTTIVFDLNNEVSHRGDFVVKEDGSRDDSIHRNMLKSMGIEAGKHFVEIKHINEIDTVMSKLTEEKKKEIIENAYKLVLERHTHMNRAQQILTDFESGRWRK